MGNCIICKKAIEPSKGQRERIYCSKNCNSISYNRRHRKELAVYAKVYQMKNREKRLIATREWRKKNRKKFNTYMQKYMLNRYYSNTKGEQVKNKSRKRINNKYKNGKISKDECAVCGSKEKLEFHHLDYKKDRVIVLCLKCHKKHHRKY